VIQRLEAAPSRFDSYNVLTDTNISKISPNKATAGYISSSGLSVSTVAEIIATNMPLAQIK